VTGAFAPLSLRLPGGEGAPRAARAAVRTRLDDHVAPALVGDIALVVSELVANSVRHAKVGPTGFVRLDLRVLAGEVWIAVGDRGSSCLPRMTASEQVGPGGLGLRMVDRLARSWGVARDGAGRTLVWCRLALDPADAGELNRS
jgi:anti-sigma regulatory factor (Ser/Thr protein kinase)